MTDVNCTCQGTATDGSSVEVNNDNCPEPAGCTQTPAPSTVCTGTSDCCCDGCMCQRQTLINPTPYYACAGACQEIHDSVVVQQQYVTGVTISNAVNMPACNNTVVLTIPGLQKIIIGAYLWNPFYGHLKVLSFDYINSQVTVKNECQVNNAAPGTAIPACTLFTVVDTPEGVEPSPCLSDTEEDGKVLVCNAGVIVPLTGTKHDDILTLDDPLTGEASYKNICDIDLSDRMLLLAFNDASTNVTGTLLNNGDTLNSNQINRRIQNPTCSNMKLLIQEHWVLKGNIIGAVATDYADIKLFCQAAIVNGLIGTTAPGVPGTLNTEYTHQYLGRNSPVPCNLFSDTGYVVLIAPGYEAYVSLRCIAELDAKTDAAVQYQILNLFNNLSTVAWAY